MGGINLMKTTINDKYSRLMINDSRIRNLIAELNGVTLLTATNWIRGKSPKLTEFDNLKLIATYYEVAEEELLHHEKINTITL
jgi:hypothetical protein